MNVRTAAPPAGAAGPPAAARTAERGTSARATTWPFAAAAGMVSMGEGKVRMFSAHARTRLSSASKPWGRNSILEQRIGHRRDSSEGNIHGDHGDLLHPSPTRMRVPSLVRAAATACTGRLSADTTPAAATKASAGASSSTASADCAYMDTRTRTGTHIQAETQAESAPRSSTQEPKTN